MIAVVALACGTALIGVAFIGEQTRAEQLQAIESNKPKPQPQMMAPREPEANERTGMVYAVGSRLVTKAGY